MSQSTPRLITFAASHFCEKARWALDWHGIAYDEIGWPPGLHLMLAKRHGAKGRTVPILLDGAKIIQGSGAIIDWAESKAKDQGRSLTPRAGLAEAKAIERRADEMIGVHVRRLAFAEMLPSHSHLVKSGAVLSKRRAGTAASRQRDAASNLAPHNAAVRPPAGRRNGEPREAGSGTRPARRQARWMAAPTSPGTRFSRADRTVARVCLRIFARPRKLPSQPLHERAPMPSAIDVKPLAARAPCDAMGHRAVPRSSSSNDSLSWRLPGLRVAHDS